MNCEMRHLKLVGVPEFLGIPQQHGTHTVVRSIAQGPFRKLQAAVLNSLAPEARTCAHGLKLESCNPAGNGHSPQSEAIGVGHINANLTRRNRPVTCLSGD